ncbi:type II CAAX endopeptidase family protein [Maioricimonas sp. JC845]|uniref:CPBP family intramembrane glutamic endopeptidase n=1 Tax=Maioricimonas sp. JC845 TaxID=3232138 RepID=UPI0034591CA2
MNASSSSRLVAARVVAGLALLACAVPALLRMPLPPGTSTIALAGLLGVLSLSEGDMPELGLRPGPLQGWWYWLKIAGLFAAFIAGLCLLGAATCLLLERPIPLPRYPPEVDWFITMVVYAPVVEEVVYRVLLTAALLPVLGYRGTIVASGVVFAAIHIAACRPGPDNLLAGFLLEWAYLKSRSVTVPLAMHAGGNLIAWSAHVAAWYGILPVG